MTTKLEKILYDAKHMERKVFTICIAYAQGVEKGLVGRKCDNSYLKSGLTHSEYDAWAFGYSEGYKLYLNKKVDTGK